MFAWQKALVGFIVYIESVHAVCPVTAQQCGECPSSISGSFTGTGVQIVGNRNMQCTINGIAALTRSGCLEGNCFSILSIDVPFSYAACADSQTEACIAWRWLHCAFPDDQTSSGTIMHAYFFVGGQFEGEGFNFATKNVTGLLTQAEISTVEDACAGQFPQAAQVVEATMAAGEDKGIVLLGWDACPCTGIAQSRFESLSFCFEQLTWSEPNSDVMKYLQCKEADPNHHSFVYFRDGGSWAFKGTGFAFDPHALSASQLQTMSTQANVQPSQNCISPFSVNIYGETLSECRAASTDASGSWMWDGKCTEKGGGVHQICMDQLPADFSVTTGQGPWSEGRANRRHCVCIGAWSLYMTREEDPAWTTSEAWPFCDAIPFSALTSRYISKWKDWNGIPAQIVLGASKLFSKCLRQRSGPGSSAPSEAGACHLASAFTDLQAHESALASIDVAQHLAAANVTCTESTTTTDVAVRTHKLDQSSDETSSSRSPMTSTFSSSVILPALMCLLFLRFM